MFDRILCSANVVIKYCFPKYILFVIAVKYAFSDSLEEVEDKEKDLPPHRLE